MLVIFDHQIFTYQEFGGISRYFYELINYYRKSGIVEAEVPLILTNNHYLEEDSLYSGTKNFLRNVHLKGKANGAKVRLMAAVNQRLVLKRLNEGNYDILHPTFYDTYFLDRISKPFVLTIYDMIEEKFNKATDKTARNKYQLALKASRIIAISEHTKKDIIEIYNIDPQKIEVVYLGNSLTEGKDNPRLDLPERYILFVGKRGGYKNFESFIKAYAELKDKALNVICAGGGAFDSREIELLKGLGIYGAVKQVRVDDTLLYYYYNRALFFVFPSLYEGFGIPLLEAFASGCPVLSSNRTSLPEIAGEAAIYFDADKPESMRQQMEVLMHNSLLRKELILKGYSRLEQFSWRNTAEQTKEVYKKVHNLG